LHSPFNIPVVTPLLPSRPVKQGELILGLYDLNQQHLVDNGGSVSVGDRLFVEIKYRTGFIFIKLFSKFFYLFLY
jgi:hypothetical protein